MCTLKRCRGRDYFDPSSFVGYPEDVARALHIPVSNASCPGETTASFFVPGAQSDRLNSPGSSTGYRTQYPLHVQYQGTQMRYALKYLAMHRHTRLVTINIGANDVFLCQETTTDHCASAAELQPVLQEIQANLTTIYTEIRDVAHYHGLLVALTYFERFVTRGKPRITARERPMTVDGRGAAVRGLPCGRAGMFASRLPPSLPPEHRSRWQGIVTAFPRADMSRDVRQMVCLRRVLVLEGQPQLGAEDDLAALLDIQVLLHHLSDTQVTERLARGAHRGDRRVFPGLSARPDDVDDSVYAHGILLDCDLAQDVMPAGPWRRGPLEASVSNCRRMNSAAFKPVKKTTPKRQLFDFSRRCLFRLMLGPNQKGYAFAELAICFDRLASLHQSPAKHCIEIV